TLTFVMMHLAPGGPFASEKKLPPQIIANLEAHYNLDKPLPVQYALYMKNLIMFDLGPSIKSEARNVNDILADGFPVSAQLGLEAMVIRSEEHTSELQSRENLVCRLLLEKKKKNI